VLLGGRTVGPSAVGVERWPKEEERKERKEEREEKGEKKRKRGNKEKEI
jgi:hypothetical protein